MSIPAPPADMPHRHIEAAPKGAAALALHKRREGEAVEPSETKFRESSRWGPIGILALAVLAVACAFAYSLITKGPPSVSIGEAQQPAQQPPPIAWSSLDQLRFEAANNIRLAKMDSMIERLDALIVTQAKVVERLLTLMERSDERVKGLEDWRRASERK